VQAWLRTIYGAAGGGGGGGGADSGSGKAHLMRICSAVSRHNVRGSLLVALANDRHVDGLGWLGVAQPWARGRVRAAAIAAGDRLARLQLESQLAAQRSAEELRASAAALAASASAAAPDEPLTPASLQMKRIQASAAADGGAISSLTSLLSAGQKSDSSKMSAKSKWQTAKLKVNMQKEVQMPASTYSLRSFSTRFHSLLYLLRTR